MHQCTLKSHGNADMDWNIRDNKRSTWNVGDDRRNGFVIAVPPMAPTFFDRISEGAHNALLQWRPWLEMVDHSALTKA
jgi:hypothetical protein